MPEANQPLQACPHCGTNKNLVMNLWSLDAGEVDAVECNGCYFAAPLTTWQAPRATHIINPDYSRYEQDLAARCCKDANPACD